MKRNKIIKITLKQKIMNLDDLNIHLEFKINN